VTLVVRPTEGLGNRIRVVSSFQVLAARSGRDLKVRWGPGSGWSGESFGELFANGIDEVDPDAYESLRRGSLSLSDLVSISGVGGSDGRGRWTPTISFASVFDVAAHPVVSYSGYQRCDWLLPAPMRPVVLPNFEPDFAAAVRGWRPVPGIQAVVDDLARDFDEHTVGVHVRRGDAWMSWDIGLPQMRSNDRAFQARLDALLAREPHTRFFLASDSEAIDREFRARYRDAIVVNPEKRFVSSLPGRPKDNQRDAVIDLFTLARTTRVIGTHWSSFSILAGVIGDIPVAPALSSRWHGLLLKAPGVVESRVKVGRRRHGIR
jgi:hypothetical protein